MDDLDKKYYKIGEVADIIGVPATTLRFWESKFTLVKPHRNSRGTRYYTSADIETIRHIYYLVKDKGYKLRAAEEMIRGNRSGVTRRYEVIECLKGIRAELAQMQAVLDAKR